LNEDAAISPDDLAEVLDHAPFIVVDGDCADVRLTPAAAELLGLTPPLKEGATADGAFIAAIRRTCRDLADKTGQRLVVRVMEQAPPFRLLPRAPNGAYVFLALPADAREFAEQAEAESRRRIRNALAIIRSIARRTAETSESVDAFTMHFEGRIDAYCRTLSLLSLGAPGGIDLGYMIAEEILAAKVREDDRVMIGGPPLSLTPRCAETLGLAIHELLANAIQHGVLGEAQGRVDVSWSLERDATPARSQVLFCWQETGERPPPTRIPRRGFGLEMLEKVMPYELGAQSKLTLRPEGLRCIIRIPFTPELFHAP
jgi:two-component system CheB/CheR fusion protein